MSSLKLSQAIDLNEEVNSASATYALRQEQVKTIFELDDNLDLDAKIQEITLDKPKPAVNIYAVKTKRFRRMNGSMESVMIQASEEFNHLSDELKDYYKKLARKEEDKYLADLAFVKQYLFLNYEKGKNIDAMLIFESEQKMEKLFRKPAKVKKELKNCP